MRSEKEIRDMLQRVEHITDFEDDVALQAISDALTYVLFNVSEDCIVQYFDG